MSNDTDQQYYANNFPLDKIKVICDECLKVCVVRRNKDDYYYAYIVSCEDCGDREMTARKSSFTVGKKFKVLLSSILEPSRRKKGRYPDSNFSKNQLLIEFDTGVLLENEEDIKLFLWITEGGRESFESLERVATRAIDLYNKFKHLPHDKDPE